VAGRIQQTAGGVELDEQRCCVFSIGYLERTIQAASGDRLDGVADVKLVDDRLGRR